MPAADQLGALPTLVEHGFIVSGRSVKPNLGGVSRGVVRVALGPVAGVASGAAMMPLTCTGEKERAHSGLRQGRAYTMTLNGEPLARMVPIRRRRAVPKEEVFAIFATAPAIDASELRADLDEAVSQDLRDPYEGTGL